MAKLIIYPTPLDALCVLTHDSGMAITGQPGKDSAGREGQVFNIPSTVPNNWGCQMDISAPNKLTLKFRALLTFYENTWYLLADDFILQDVPPPVIIEPPNPIPIPPTPSPDTTPLGIINHVYATGAYNLTTKEDCGIFTEACVKALHEQSSVAFGELKKIPPQNNYNGHAVDAVNLLGGVGTTKAGIYDIIINSESLAAKPAFNWVDPPRPDLWYYP